MDDKVLEQIYRERLEERIIAHLAKETGMSLEEAMDVYYHSEMATMIYEGKYGIQYLDYKVLVQVLCEMDEGLIAAKKRQGLMNVTQ